MDDSSKDGAWDGPKFLSPKERKTNRRTRMANKKNREEGNEKISVSQGREGETERKGRGPRRESCGACVHLVGKGVSKEGKKDVF